MRIPRRLPIYPWNDNEPIYFGTGSDYSMYFNGTNFRLDGPAGEFQINMATAAITRIYGGVTAADDLYIYPNSAVASTYMKINGAGSFEFITNTVMSWFMAAGACSGRLSYVNPDMILECLTDAKNIYLKPTGVGKVKFGVVTGSGDVVCNGSLAMLDAAGNAVKLMTTA